jgi:hypothetical protein
MAEPARFVAQTLFSQGSYVAESIRKEFAGAPQRQRFRLYLIPPKRITERR